MAAFFTSQLLCNKLDLVHIANSTLPGGITIGVSARLNMTPGVTYARPLTDAYLASLVDHEYLLTVLIRWYQSRECHCDNTWVGLCSGTFYVHGATSSSMMTVALCSNMIEDNIR